MLRLALNLRATAPTRCGSDCTRLLPVGFGDTTPAEERAPVEFTLGGARLGVLGQGGDAASLACVDCVNASLRVRPLGGRSVERRGRIALDPCAT